MVGKELEDKRALLLHDPQRAASKFHQVSRDGITTERTWKRAQTLFRHGAQSYNKQVLTYNLKLPPGIAHKAQLDVEGEIIRALSEAAQV
jgi:hypothetical protein